MYNNDISDNNIMVLGNHDTWGGDRTGDYTKENFIKYSKEATGREIDNVYFTAEINGYPVIVLGSQSDHTGPTFYQDQLDWFAEEMEKASEKGLPIFVFCHQPFNGTHGLPYNWELEKDADPTEGGIGEHSDYILNICNQYKNVIFISGHVHAGLSNTEDGTNYSSVEKVGNVTSVNLPSYEYFDVLRHGHMVNGTGFVFEVYEGEILLRARNFATGTWYPDGFENITSPVENIAFPEKKPIPKFPSRIGVVTAQGFARNSIVCSLSCRLVVYLPIISEVYRKHPMSKKKCNFAR